MKKLSLFIFGLIGTGILFGLLGLGAIFLISFDLPEISSLKDYQPPVTTKVISQDGEVLLETAKEKRILTPISEIPEEIIQAFLSAEDDNFYEHNGVDYWGIFRAALINLKAGGLVQGGSTITQQVAKSLLLSRERTISRKIKDFLLAQRIEKKFSKEEILYLYLNQVYLGAGYYGVKAAFEGYFGKELKDVTIAESALVAGLLVAPGKYSPYINPKSAKARQKYVLGRMLATEKISQAQFDGAMNEAIPLRPRRQEELKAPYFVDWIRQRIVDELGKDAFLTYGLKIQTTLNWELQQVAKKAVKKGIEQIDRRQGFKGPLKHIKNEAKRKEFLANYRKKLIKKYSDSILFMPEGELFYELEEQEDVLAQSNQEREEKLSEVSKRWRVYIETGNQEDPLAQALRPFKKYRCLVTRVSNSERLIYGSIGGVKVAIPEEHFSWAHERYIEDEPRYFSPINYPESILKAGDIVWVELKGEQKTAWSLMHQSFRKRTMPDEVKELFQTEKFYVAELTQIPEVQGALLALKPSSGHILSMVGGHNFRRSQFNRAVQSQRQPGSAFKPMIYAAALENGFNPASILLDSPQALGGSTELLNWKPRNYDNKFKGPMTLRRALEVSRNIPTIKLVQEIGVDKLAEFTARLGLELDLPKDLSVSLGSFGISLKDLVRAYALFPSLGKKIEAQGIVSVSDSRGKEYDIERFRSKDSLSESDLEDKSLELTQKDPQKEGAATQPPPSEVTPKSLEEQKRQRHQKEFVSSLGSNRAYDQRLSFIMSNLLQGVVANGTGRKARSLSTHIGGKTGTTNNYVDAWFVGFSPEVVTGVWTGFDDNKTMGHAETGSRSALPIWKDYMDKALELLGDYDFPEPRGLVNRLIDRETGRPLERSAGNAFLETFVEGFGPGSTSEDEGITTRQSVLDDEGFFSD